MIKMFTLACFQGICNTYYSLLHGYTTQHLRIITFKIIIKVLLRLDETNMNTLNLKQCGLCVSKLFSVVSKLFVTSQSHSDVLVLRYECCLSHFFCLITK